LPCNADVTPIFGNANLTAKAGNSTPVAILDNNTVNSFATVGACTGATILDVNVNLNIAHTWVSDLTVSLVSPAGTTVVLWPRQCGANDNLRFGADDEAAACTNLCADYVSGNTFQPIACLGAAFGSTDFLSKLDGQNPAGQWALRVQDGVGGDVGFINSWSIEVLYNAPTGTAPVVDENCCLNGLTYLDSEVPGDCASGNTRVIARKWTATDCYGNTSTCVQNISMLRPTLNDIVAPPDYDGIDAPSFSCEDGSMPIIDGHPNPTPNWIESVGLQGYPYVFGLPSGCNINWEWHDYIIPVCDGTVKYRREWTIIDWCTGAGFIYNQILKVVDETGPEFACPSNLTVSTDPFACCATINMPDVIVEDNCSRINNISGMIQIFDQYTGEQINMLSIGGSLTNFPGNNLWDRDTLANFGWAPCLPLGTHIVTYIAEDDCGNTSSCTFRLIVRDYTPPVASCDETTTVAIGIDDPFDCYGPAGPNDLPAALDACSFAGVTWVKASTFNDGSYDQCNGVKFTIRRMSPYSDCILGLNSTNGFLPCNDNFPDFPSEFERAISEQDSIKFYCCEVGTTQTVILRVYQVDVIGNIMVGQDGTPIFNECMIQVEVQDKLKPVCLPPAQVSVNCENFDPSLWAYGKAQVADNCCLDTTKVYQDQCGLTHTVSYTLFDTVCNKGTITRTFRAFDCHGFSSQCTQRVIVTYDQDYFVKFPNDVIVTVCDGSGVYGEPTFFGEDCELLGVSYEDQVYTVVPDACFKIERTWTIINWCTYNPNLPCIEVPNPNPNPITNAAANLAGPTVSACGTLALWAPTSVRINPTDPQPTNFCTFWDKNANCYKYKQIIKIIDGQAPTGTFVVPDCSNANWFTPNNSQLWNEMYWWNNNIGLHDLCEEPTDLCITGTDACSGANVNIEYLLFLDLDGDGSMETVINSVNTGIAAPTGLGWNNVLFNNLNTPNFAGGIPRAFDERPVPSNQKYGFGIQETVSGNSKTACVRWNTQQQQNTYVTPELPHGTHKIKWFITDGCGNNKEYEYTFTVKDCKAPTVVCLNGLSVNIMPTGMITLWASDFLQYTEDNCTPTNLLKIGIRKCGTGTGFPVDVNGNPITNVTFTCAETGTQCVELWSIDVAGNADYCETYVIVQDNNGNCPNGSINVAGVLKTEAQDGVEEAVVNINGSVNFAPPFAYFDLSDNGGIYEVKNNVPVASTFVIAPEKDDNPLNGVTTYDLVLISKHILGIEPLSTPYKMISADANKSGSITTFDIVELRKLILGIYTELPNNTSWRFVDKSFSFPNANNPFQTAFPETVSVADAQLHQFGEDFAGVKIGDVNGSAVANATMQAEERTAGTAIFDVADRNVKAGEEFEVSFTSAQAVKGFQFTATLNGLTAISTVDAENVTPGNFNLTPANAMAVSIDGAQGFTVRFRAEKAGKLSEMLGVSGSVTRAEAYGDAGRLNVAFRFDGKTIAGVGFELYQNQPNPFVNRTFVGFFLPEAAEATLSVFDETGRVVYQQKGQFAKGENTIALDRALINTTGVLFYKLETATDSATKKMIQAK
jgi:subtilisin-like proprotein convertase family protein